MSFSLSDSLPLFTESADDELRYHFQQALRLVQQRRSAESAGLMTVDGKSSGYTREQARLRLLEEMLIEQMPAQVDRASRAGLLPPTEGAT